MPGFNRIYGSGKVRITESGAIYIYPLYVDATLAPLIPPVVGHSRTESLFELAPYQTAMGTGPLVWSLIDAPTNLRIDTATGQMSVTQGTAIPTATDVGVSVYGTNGVPAQATLSV